MVLTQGDIWVTFVDKENVLTEDVAKVQTDILQLEC